MYLVPHYIAALKRWRCCLQMLGPTISLPSTWSWQTVALCVSGSGQPLAIFSTFWHQRTSWWVCPITHETTERLYNYIPLVFVNCYGDWTPVKGTIVDVRDIVTPMVHYDVRFHLVFVYIGLNCASLSVVLVFEAEQSYSRRANHNIIRWDGINCVTITLATCKLFLTSVRCH